MEVLISGRSLALTSTATWWWLGSHRSSVLVRPPATALGAGFGLRQILGLGMGLGLFRHLLSFNECVDTDILSVLWLQSCLELVLLVAGRWALLLYTISRAMRYF